jgi:hypothetical protein
MSWVATQLVTGEEATVNLGLVRKCIKRNGATVVEYVDGEREVLRADYDTLSAALTTTTEVGA